MPIGKPKVNPVNEFRQIAIDFTNPLEIIREAVSNSFDANASHITILFHHETIDGEDTLKIIIRDNGDGMDQSDLENFFDLGNSSRLNDPNSIGEKGHGTKVYFNSKKLIVKSKKGGQGIEAKMNNVWPSLKQNIIPDYEWELKDIDFDKGTEITVIGYNSKFTAFTHEEIKDYIIRKLSVLDTCFQKKA
jgi:DNA topoisomerase VI subunit B